MTGMIVVVLLFYVVAAAGRLSQPMHPQRLPNNDLRDSPPGTQPPGAAQYTTPTWSAASTLQDPPPPKSIRTIARDENSSSQKIAVLKLILRGVEMVVTLIMVWIARNDVKEMVVKSLDTVGAVAITWMEFIKAVAIVWIHASYGTTSVFENQSS